MPFVGCERLDIIGYRGVDIPAGVYQQIFLHGFKQKQGSKDIEDYADLGGGPNMMYYNNNMEGFSPKAGDMNPDTANCVSTRLAAAALFPNDTKKLQTWIFAVYVESGFNTYERQQLDAWEIIEFFPEVFTDEKRLSSVTWPLDAEEFAAVAIPGKHVLGCVRATRTWASGDWHDGGTYRLHQPLYWNGTADRSFPNAEERINKVEKFLLRQLAFHPTGTIPATRR